MIHFEWFRRHLKWILSGFDVELFIQTRSTFMSEPYEVPSAGDWSVHRGGAVFVEHAHNISFERCLFNQVGPTLQFTSSCVVIHL